MLMGCGSGIQVIREGNDALGLANTFLSARATSVMATLWPLDQTDAANNRVSEEREFHESMFAAGVFKEKTQRPAPMSSGCSVSLGAVYSFGKLGVPRGSYEYGELRNLKGSVSFAGRLC
ncbi:hypothetical protein BDW59DRAFT_159260 [Aspergillus cavernicola]|uniref:Uncharacterized protein n=1 Tax=Aspergillus cavernicola TaxID=176166 RepID=A0ABR4INB8_9EURO